MPFQSHGEFSFPWEQTALTEDFIDYIDPHSAFAYWTRIHRAVTRRGVLIVRRYTTPLGVIGSPELLCDVLMTWTGYASQPHGAVQEQLARLAAEVASVQVEPFTAHTLQIQMRPNSVTLFIQELAAQGSLAAIFRRKSLVALIIPMSLLARFRREAASQRSSVWVTAVLNWVTGVIGESLES